MHSLGRSAVNESVNDSGSGQSTSHRNLSDLELVDRTVLQGSPLDAARHILGARLLVSLDSIVAEITEVEAYGGPADSPWPDPAAHCYPGLTQRNRAMFGEAGHWYVYQSYGIHKCLNITCGPDGIGGGVLIRSLRILDGEDAVRTRRGDKPTPFSLARGPGNVGLALGVTLSDYGQDALDTESRMHVLAPQPPRIAHAIHSGPRVGIRRASERKWRLWLDDETVSTYRRHAKASGEY